MTWRLCGVGERALRCEPLGRAAFHLSYEDSYDGEYAAGQEAHPPQRERAPRSTHSRQPHPDLHQAVESAIASGKKDDAAEALKKAQPELARGVARGVIHKNTASRKFSRLSKRVASLG